MPDNKEGNVIEFWTTPREVEKIPGMKEIKKIEEQIREQFRAGELRYKKGDRVIYKGQIYLVESASPEIIIPKGGINFTLVLEEDPEMTIEIHEETIEEFVE